MKTLLIILSIIISMPSYAQKTRAEVKAELFAPVTVESVRKHHPNACHFYNSAEDYYNNKFIENMDWNPRSYTMLLGTEKIEVVKNGKVEKTKFEDLQNYWWSSEDGMLMRMYKNAPHIVVVDGPICYYIRFRKGGVDKQTDGTLTFGYGNYHNDPFDRNSINSKEFYDFYSRTLTGELVAMDKKETEKLLEEHGLLIKYNNEKIKREMKDSVNGYKNKEVQKLVKYLRLINEELAKKN